MRKNPDLTVALDLVEQQREAGLHDGAQLFVSIDGNPIIDIAIGERVPSIALKNDDLMMWYSASKPVTTVAILQLWERGLLRLDDLVADFIDGWGSGKERCTIRHVLTHTGGFSMPGADPFDADLTYAEAIALIAAHPAEHPPGTQAAYHPSTGWKVLGAIVESVDGRPIDRYVRENVFEPLGMTSCHMGIPLDEQSDLGSRITPIAWKGYAIPSFADGALQMVEYRMDQIHNEPWHVAKVEPGGSMRGPARELARFYESLLGFGPPIIEPRTIEVMIAAHRTGMPDRTYLNQTFPWGLGVEIATKIPGHPGRRAFGHGGMASSRGLADPDCGLVMAFITNGLPNPLAHERRVSSVIDAVYDALGDGVAHLRLIG